MVLTIGFKEQAKGKRIIKKPRRKQEDKLNKVGRKIKRLVEKPERRALADGLGTQPELTLGGEAGAA